MEERLKQLLSAGREHYEKREFEQAETFLLEVATALPQFADVHNMLGVIHHHKGNYDLSRQAFEKALKINPRYTEAALNLAVTYNELGQYEAAKEVYERVVTTSRSGPRRLDPYARGKIANMHAELARAYEDVRMLDEAIKQYAEALQLCPEFVDIRTRLGHVLRDSGDVEGAVVEYREAKRNRPEFVPARVHLGVSLFALGNRVEAIAEWEAALELDPDNRVALTYLRMVRQLEAQSDAELDGVKIDVQEEEGTIAAHAKEEAKRRTLYRPDPELASNDPSPGLDDAATAVYQPKKDQPEPSAVGSESSGTRDDATEPTKKKPEDTESPADETGNNPGESS